MSNDNVNLLE